MRFKIPSPILKAVGRPMLQAQAHSPEVLLVAGVVGVTSAAVLACRATLKLDEVLEEANKKQVQIETIEMDGYGATDKTKDLATLKVVTARRVVRLYAPSVGLGVLSLGALIGSNRILSTRNAGLMAAYAALEKGFDAYREKVMQEVGPEKERELRYGSQVGRVHNEKTGITEHVLADGVSIYARFFDETSRNWNRNLGYNQMFLMAQQNYANDLLRSRGHVFLNEVYDMLGLERSKEGAVVGWVRGNGDDFIDFGVFEGDVWSAQRFVNLDEPSVLLDFNVDGVIWDKI